MVNGKEEGCFDTGTSAICLPCREMPDDPAEMADSNLRVRVANKNIEKVEGEGHDCNNNNIILDIKYLAI